MIFVAKGPVKWWLEKTGYKGITLPPFGIFITEDRIDNQRLRNHELAHWKQAQELGVVKFYAKYLWLNVRHGYKENPMEVEARKAEYPLPKQGS
jgi:hypothetical protein